MTAQPYGLGCKAFVVASNPVDGNILRRITHASPSDSSDYDPSWSPLGHEITFGRRDSRIYRKGVPGFSADTSTYRVTAHDDGSQFHRGDLNGSVSPDGRWVAFARRTIENGPYELFKIPMNGDSSQTQKLTSHETLTDYYPSWSPDGEYLLFQRGNADTGFVLMRVRANGTSEEAFYDHDTGKPYGYEATTPAYSPDGRIVLAGIGPSGATDSTIDTTHVGKIPIKSWNYNSAEFAVPGEFPILTPRRSPDGTRLAIASDQLWAARRNMNLPPRITEVGTQSVVDSTARVFINAAYGLETEVDIVSTDPEGDDITCDASFLQDGMAFDDGDCVLTWTPTLTVGSVVHVKFQITNNSWPDESGGSDQVIGIFTVTSPSPQAAQSRRPADERLVEGPNPTRAHFVISTPRVLGQTSNLLIWDVAGRVVRRISGPAGTPLRWDGSTRRGDAAAPGVYIYDLRSGSYGKTGRIVVVR